MELNNNYKFQIIPQSKGDQAPVFISCIWNRLYYRKCKCENNIKEN